MSMNWKRQIRSLCKDFRLSETETENIITQTAKETENRNRPAYFKNRADWRYSVAQRKVRSIITQL